ncbi:MAG: pyruvate, phosphate dikinase [Spirochaetales bacterium]|nr:pyruvate, phosphate dikinase [Spirochaetales bacterium]
MKDNIHLFSRKIHTKDPEIIEKIGIRGSEYMEFAALDLPILPGFIIDSEVAAYLEDEDLKPYLEQSFTKIEDEAKKQFGDAQNPMLVKIVISSSLAIMHYPFLHNYGLTDETIPGFISFVGAEFGYHEILFLIKGNLTVEAKLAELENRAKDLLKINEMLDTLTSELDKEMSAKEYARAIEKYKSFLDPSFFADSYSQLEIALKQISRMLKLDEMNADDAALIVQPMAYGNYGKDSGFGGFYTRNIVTGEELLDGFFYQNTFNEIGSAGKDINKLDPKYLKELQKTARVVEDHFREIRSIRFTVENKRVWLLDQRPVMTKSTQSDIITLLDLNKRKVINEKHLINAIKPGQLNEILHPIIDPVTVKSMKKLAGGIAGAPGAAIGRAYFTTDGLLEAFKNAQQLGQDTRCILCMPATFAEDVKAIEVASGVLSGEGGYSAHASVVARQYGKVSLVLPELKIRGNRATIGDASIKEGDFISMSVPQYGDPTVYFGVAGLIEPDPKESGLLDFIAIVKRHVKAFHVRANADKPGDAALALKFGADGIGLCRTEHMFFDEKRINVFREMIISDTKEKRVAALKKLKGMQKKDFYEIFKVLQEKPATIRLLDAPLHEFLPHTRDELRAFVGYLNKGSKAKSAQHTEKEIQAICDNLKEFNPMLGHRGCRIAVSFPEIYEMQIKAIFEAVYQLQVEGINTEPEIMIPLIMNEDELKLIVYGKKIEGDTYVGLTEIEQNIRAELVAAGKSAKKTTGSSKIRPITYKVGTMIELPAAALSASDIARYAGFFSFGTNDLTQTTLGLSRDDYTSFMPDYTLFDIIAGNPFMNLNVSVKELIATAVRRGRLTRPELKTGLCGEHGAIPENIKYCMDVGLNYVSCSSYSVPIALLAIAQFNLEQSN